MGITPEIARTVVLFPRAVGAEKRHDLAGLHFERNALERMDAAIFYVEVFYDEHVQTLCAHVQNSAVSLRRV